MLFNSLEFALFFPAVFGLYLLLPHRGRNTLLLAASYVFYGAWDWRFLSLLVLTTALDYACALGIENSRAAKAKKAWLGLSIVANLTVLGFFKYWNFFTAEMESLLAVLGLPFHPATLSLILPVGISFYTFQSMSYVVDVYRGEIRATRRLDDFALFVSFFPQLVAGPIERAGVLLPQIQNPRKVTWIGIRAGIYLFAMGLFKKCVIADNLAPLSDAVFANPAAHGGAAYLVAALAFAFQIYGDFSGYSDMARGLASSMGFELTENFRFPYFSRNVEELWHRWHVTLSRWFRDYVYIPLGGSRGGMTMTCRNILITMTLSGLWHGASAHFVLWGFYHGVILFLYKLASPLWRNPLSGAKKAGIPWQAVSILLTFAVMAVGWVLFRADSVGIAWTMLSGIFQPWDWSLSGLADLPRVMAFGGFLLAVEWIPWRNQDSLVYLEFPFWARTAHYVFLLGMLILYGAPPGKPFIYFQF